MTPYDQAKDLYRTQPQDTTFEEDLEWHFKHGVISSSHDHFLMASKQSSDGIAIDTWHVYLFAGDIRKAFQAADVQLPFVSFRRKGKIKEYQWDVIVKKTQRIFTQVN